MPEADGRTADEQPRDRRQDREGREVNRAIEAPLYFGNVLLYPNMGDPVSQSGDGGSWRSISRSTRDGTHVTDSTVELLQATAGRSPPRRSRWATPAAALRSRAACRAPATGDARAGTYELRVSVTDGRTSRRGRRISPSARDQRQPQRHETTKTH